MSEELKKIWIYPESTPDYYEKPVEYAVYKGIEFIRADLYEAEIAALKQKFTDEREHAEWLQKQIDEDVRMIYERNAEITALKAELKQQFEESISIIHDQGAENIKLREDLALNAKMLARQTDVAREAETEAARLRNALDIVQANYDIYTTALVKFAVDEALK